MTLVAAFSATAVAAPKAPEVGGQPQGPLLVVVSIATQRMAVYDRTGRILESPISSGQTGYDTPQGVFAVIERNREHFSNIYDDAPMPNMQRITWSGVAMHAGRLPGYPASHGCIRLPMGVSDKLFGMTRLGTRVVVAEHDVMPAAFEHPKLFSMRSDDASTRVASSSAVRSDAGSSMPMRLGGGELAAAEAAGLPAFADPFADMPAGMSKTAFAADLLAKAKEADARYKTAKGRSVVAAREATRTLALALAAERSRSLVSARVDALDARLAGNRAPVATARAQKERAAAMVRLAELNGEIDRLRAAAETKQADADRLSVETTVAEQVRNTIGTQARDANRSFKPVSVFVSRKSGRLYVRQGFQPVFDVPVAIADAGSAIGTHVYTALDTKPGSAAMEWSAVTTVGATPSLPEPYSKRQRKTATARMALIDPMLTASAALDRVEIPTEVRRRIESILMPGSSLIISDEAVSAETGKGTDFVILTR